MVQVRIEIEHRSIIKRWISTEAIFPVNNGKKSPLQLTGKAVILDCEGTTRSSRPFFNTTVEDIKGKLCVFKSLDEQSSNEALIFAKKSGAQALLTTHLPSTRPTIPTILIPRDLSAFMNKLPSKPQVTVVPLTGSYTTVNVTLTAELMSDSTKSVEWKSKMFIPVTLVKETTHSLQFAEMMDITRYAFRDHRDKLSSLDFCGADDHVSGKICLFNATHAGDANRVVELLTKHGARALILVGKDVPDHTEITLPVLDNIDKDLLMHLKNAGLDSTGIDFGLTIEYTGEVKTKPSSSDPQSKIDAPETPPASPASHRHSHQKKDPPTQSQGFFGGIKAGVKAIASAFVSYTPKSGKEFREVIKAGTSWSFEGKESRSYQRAIEILDKIDNKIGKKEEQEQEMEALAKAVAEMTSSDSFVGDLMVLLFCHQMTSLMSKLGMRALGEFYDAMIEVRNIHAPSLCCLLVRFLILCPAAIVSLQNVSKMVIDTEGFNLSLRLEDKTAIDQCICHLTRRVSDKADNMSKHSVFVLNAIWIRSYVCQALRFDSWEDLRKVTTLKHISSHQSVITSFMDPSEYNTLLITSIARDQDLITICKLFNESVICGEGIPMKPRALRRLRIIYEANKSSQEEWLNNFKETRELTMLNIIGKLNIYGDRKQDIIGSVIKRASFESLGSFDGLHSIVSPLSIHHTNYDLIVREINTSACSSLSRTGKMLPSLTDVSKLLHSPIGATLLNGHGWKALMTYLSKIKESGNGIRDQIELLSDVYDSFLRDPKLSENRMNYKDELEKIIMQSVQQTDHHLDFALWAFQIANERHDMFMGSNIICRNVAKIIINQTGLASTVRESPSILDKIPSFQLVSQPGASFIECLSYELIARLKALTANIENAVSFCMRTSSAKSQLIADIASSILISSFSNWNPSSLEDLLNEDASTLENVHTLMMNAPTDIGRARQGVTKLKSISTKWVVQFNQNAFDASQLDKILRCWTVEKQNALREISGQEFPSKIDLEKKIQEIKTVLEATRSMLTFHFGVSSVSIQDIAVSYRLYTTNGSVLHGMTSLFFGNTDPSVPLALIKTHRDKVDALVTKHGRELNAAAYFIFNKSLLFHHYFGPRAELELDDLLDKLSTILDKFELLLSPEANFSLISEAAKALEKENCNIESELEVIKSFPYPAMDINNTSTAYLQHSMTVAIMSKPLKNFIASCTAYKFAFVTADADFSELCSICDMLEGDEGLEVNARKCYEMGNRIADILVPYTNALDLTARLDSCLPIFRFFDELRFCSTTFAFAGERNWFGDDGLKTFYQEYSNVSNIFSSNQESYESEILDRLEPTIRAISSIGGALDRTSVATLLVDFKGRDDIFKVDEMRMIQTNICKIQVS